MYKYSNISQMHLENAHPVLQEVFKNILEFYDHTILDAYRSPETQLDLYNRGFSKTKKGKHNTKPSLAVDAAPYPINYDLWQDDQSDLYFFGGLVLCMAWKLFKIRIRWGGDWNMNYNFHDERDFRDLFHFELP